jgi:hypothetical protein
MELPHHAKHWINVHLINLRFLNVVWAFRGYLPLLLLFILAMSGCATPVSGQREALPLVPPAPLEGEWRVIHFTHAWPEGQEPRWHMDALVAHQVVAPTLRRYQQQIPLWRFHRRAARDAAGHRLRFIYYANKKVAAEVRREIDGNELLRELLAKGWLSKVSHEGFGEQSARLSATSDPSWAPAVQAAWPHYIMGVSRTWLELIAAAEGGRTRSVSDAATLVNRYREVDAEVSALWNKHGQHAFLHHLSGVYGYKALEVRY